VEKILYKFVLPDTNVVADITPNEVTPLAVKLFKDFEQGDQIEIVSMHYDIFKIVIVVRWGDDERTFTLKAVQKNDL
jgi:hypothetical protein